MPANGRNGFGYHKSARAWRTLVFPIVGLALLLVLGLDQLAPPPARESPPAGTAMTSGIGFTFSQRQAEYLNMPWRQAFQAAADLSPSVVRLGAYWDEIEPESNVYDFRSLDWLIDDASTRNLRVMLTVGMKAPRWPEYYLPGWVRAQVTPPDSGQVSDDPRLRALTLDFVAAVVNRYRDRDAIVYWQVENEPLDAAGPNGWRIGVDFLAEEVSLVRSLDARHRPIVVNTFVATDPLSRILPGRDKAQERARVILQIADVLGLDVYPSIGTRVLGHDIYLDWSGGQWQQTSVALQQLARSYGKQAWIVEAQAEPWEPARLVNTGEQQSRSLAPSTAASIVQRLQEAGFQNVLLWGVEHWYMRLEQYKDDSWWNALRPFFPLPATPPPHRDIETA